MNLQDIFKSISGGVNVVSLFKLMAPGLKEKIVKELVMDIFGDPPIDIVQLNRATFETKVRDKLSSFEQKIVAYLDKQKEGQK